MACAKGGPWQSARELLTEAGFRIEMSDGGLVTKAKPMIKWDKVKNFNIILIKLR